MTKRKQKQETSLYTYHCLKTLNYQITFYKREMKSRQLSVSPAVSSRDSSGSSLSSFRPEQHSHFCFSFKALNPADLHGTLHKSALARHHFSFPPHFHSQRCVSNITSSVTEPRVQASDSAFPPHP